MPTLPAEVLAVLMPFASVFSPTTFAHIQVLFVGALLTPGPRTIASCLRAVGLEDESHFTNYHRVLNRAKWSSRSASRLLLLALIEAFVPQGPILLGLDDTIERRRGAHIKARGIYRDPVRSSHGHFVKCSGLRWLCLMLLVPVPFAKRVWALPFLSVLCPSARYFEQHRNARQPKKLTDWARQMLLQVRRWLPKRSLIVVADSGFAVIEMLACWQKERRGYAPITAITRLRLDAALFEPAPPRPKGQNGRPRKRGQRLPTLAQQLLHSSTCWHSLTIPGWYQAAKSRPRGQVGQQDRQIEIATGTALWSNTGKAVVPIRWVLIRDPLGQFAPQALLCTDGKLEPLEIVSYFVRRWQVEVTFHEVRQHLGVETQRQWNDQAIERTTPLLLALFSLVTLIAHTRVKTHSSHMRPPCGLWSAWYHKKEPTFIDALAWVRRASWLQSQQTFLRSQATSPLRKPQLQFLQHMTDLLAYAPSWPKSS
ncbi:hypothetical protein IAD21_02326 [Abditibacteriota bacterium]|nr:hypothetical protein IAD21_02326 [Abditibacteriota bacterium]